VAESRDGKLTPKAIQEFATNRQDIHFPKPRAVTISQSTETGRVYTVEELRALSSVCVKHGLRFHMDGARFANACASLGCSPADLTWRSGVDVLCFGGTKNGMAVGEAILFFNRELAEDFDYRCKQAGQLASKMRFLAAPWVGMLDSGAWLRNAEHANAGARYLARQLSQIEGIRVVSAPEANAVFVNASDEILEALRQLGWKFYTFIGGAARFMCSWDTDQKRMDEFCKDVRVCAQSALATRSRG
jgi:threonine aldolase